MYKIGKEYNGFCLIMGKPKIGKETWIGFFTVIDGSGGLEIGKHCSIASGVHIYTHDGVRWARENLKTDYKNYSHVDQAPVKIGDNCFIGANSTILKGVTIGNRVIIGANSVVNKDIPADSLAVGNPVKIIKNIKEKIYKDGKWIKK